ncbi:hypothetical protein A6V39_05130 [Candidatus Mycoplasma haematobovis]|uniref:Uncharacterized protein n=1 Tax=Candidatus Mycoplasma haematobovis TaxID=432608 RepID=A0A1A9QCS2_9MOLU|nr:hypothetical protein [Candidatus Mycoplasma haematobovis]OAL09811.1 hypothetical protein A6V39_05130 [Candidatus Mycoplasma haematobovis]
MGVSPVHVAGVVLTGGLVTGGYFTYQALVPPTLEEYLKKLNVDLISSNWGEKEAKYKLAQETDLIPNISKSTSTNVNNDFARQLQEWCEKKKSKNYLGETDLTYKRFSLWCTVTKKIKDVLGGRKLKALDDIKKQAKVTAYGQLQEGERFITKSNKKPATIEAADLNKWCEDEQNKDYQYEGDENLKKVISWCYDK